MVDSEGVRRCGFSIFRLWLVTILDFCTCLVQTIYWLKFTLRFLKLACCLCKYTQFDKSHHFKALASSHMEEKELGWCILFYCGSTPKKEKKGRWIYPKKKKGGRKKSSVALSGSKLAYGTKLIGLMMRRQSPWWKMVFACLVNGRLLLLCEK